MTILLRKGIRVQRRQAFQHRFADLSGIEIISRDMTNCFVNGLPNTEIEAKGLFNKEMHHGASLLQAHHTDDFEFIKIELNHFIGNPR